LPEEGYSRAIAHTSSSKAIGHLVIAALSSSNLLAVAREMRERYPAAILVILSDLVKVTGDPDPHAIEAARAVGGLLAIPDFGEDRPEDLKDLNDLAVLRGREAVQLAIASAKAPDRDEARPGT
jgi:putative DNA primase/helicase